MTDQLKIQIYVVDDDPSVRQALGMLFLSADMDVQTFERGKDFMNHEIKKKNACLITDIKMRGLSGFDLQDQLAQRGISIPIIFLTACDSRETRQRAKQTGAIAYFRKPIDDQALLDTIHWALGKYEA